MEDVLAVAHHLEQERHDAVAAVDGVRVQAEGVVAVGHLRDVEVGEEVAFLGVVGQRVLADHLVEGVGLVAFMHQHGAGERDGVLAEHHHGVVGGGHLGTHLHAGGLGAVGQVGLHPVSLSLITEVTDRTNVTFHCSITSGDAIIIKIVFNASCA